jgi:hypothetical protein
VSRASSICNITSKRVLSSSIVSCLFVRTDCWFLAFEYVAYRTASIYTSCVFLYESSSEILRTLEEERGKVTIKRRQVYGGMNVTAMAVRMSMKICAAGERQLRQMTKTSQSQSYITTDGLSASPSWYQAPIWDPRRIFPIFSLIFFFLQFRFC